MLNHDASLGRPTRIHAIRVLAGLVAAGALAGSLALLTVRVVVDAPPMRGVATDDLSAVNGAIWAAPAPSLWGPDVAELNAAFWAPPPLISPTIGITEMYGAFWAAPPLDLAIAPSTPEVAPG
jgi:hypothetical protein